MLCLRHLNECVDYNSQLPSKHTDVFVTLWRRSVNVSETLRFYVIVALSCQFFFAVITTYTNYVILKRFKADPEVRNHLNVIKTKPNDVIV